ncbi:MAG: efflux RND transporter periplasmic adaptor subunit [Candidatus Palauibacterales bacterium]|nr:efflux RND transporter periplasmic adaptor subunit [Candidatus Palauibacterales bacterium]
METQQVDVETRRRRGNGAGRDGPPPPDVSREAEQATAGTAALEARPWARWRRRLVYATAELVLAAAAVWALRPSPVAIETGIVDRGSLRATVSEEGTTRLLDRYRIAAPVTGRLLRLELSEGDRVEAGQVVARIASPPLDPRTGVAARARVTSAEAALRQAMAALEHARSLSEQADRELPRRRELAAAGAISPEALEQAQVLAATRHREIQVAEAAVGAAESEVAAAKAGVMDATPVGASSVVEVRSPVSGRVLRVPEASERAVAAGEGLVDVGDTESIEIVSEVLSTDAVRIRPGIPVLVEDWGGDDVLRGQVTGVEPEAFTKVSALGVQEQRVRVTGEIPVVPPGLGVGYRVEIRFVVWQAEDVVRIPAGALFRRGEAWRVFVVEGGRARGRQVDVGERGEDRAEVRGGLHPGDRVILYPSDRVEEGVRVRERE